MSSGTHQAHVVVTGGTRGIGRATVHAFARQGAAVSTCYAHPGDASDLLEKELAEIGADYLIRRADVSDEDQVKQFIANAQERFGPIDAVINNAGVVSHRTLADLETAEWHRVLDINLTSMYLVSQAALPFLAAGASIVNVTSAVAMRGMAARVHYTAAKSGVLGLTRSMCKELGPLGIRVNAVAPGLVDTDQMSGLPAEAAQRYTKMIALGRFAQPDEIADVITFLAGDQARYMTGATVHVDGGI